MEKPIILRSYKSIENITLEMGFLPFFKNGIPDFSVEEFTPEEYWFQEDIDGPWEWKGAVARNGKCAYGKFFHGKTGYISLEWLPEFANYRRKSTAKLKGIDKKIYEAIDQCGSLSSKEIKAIFGFNAPHKKQITQSMDMDEVENTIETNSQKEVKKGFDTIMTRLQMQTYIVVADFEYSIDKHNKPYGWGIARYTTPEQFYGKEIMNACHGHSAAKSKQLIVEHLLKMLPQASESQILKEIL
jgi:hypothetical protein